MYRRRVPPPQYDLYDSPPRYDLYDFEMDDPPPDHEEPLIFLTEQSKAVETQVEEDLPEQLDRCQDGVYAFDGNEMPRLVYVSREKRPGFDHHKRAGAMKALHILERGDPLERSQIINKLSGQVVQMSQHKLASNVIEKCLEYDSSAERELLIMEIVGQTEGNDSVLIMMKDQCANYVVQKILDVCTDAQRELLLGCIRSHSRALYGYDAPVRLKPPGKTCNCWPEWCSCCCCGSRRKGRKGNKKLDKKKRRKANHKEVSPQIHAPVPDGVSFDEVDASQPGENDTVVLRPDAEPGGPVQAGPKQPGPRPSIPYLGRIEDPPGPDWKEEITPLN